MPGGGEGMDIISLAKRLHQERVLTEVGEQAQFDLRIVC
jgi:hypothetical protein